MNKPLWTNQEKESLCFMYKAGIPIKDIAKSIGRTEKSCYNFIQRNRDALDLGRRKTKRSKSTVAIPIKENMRGWLSWIDRLIK